MPCCWPKPRSHSASQVAAEAYPDGVAHDHAAPALGLDLLHRFVLAPEPCFLLKSGDPIGAASHDAGQDYGRPARLISIREGDTGKHVQQDEDADRKNQRARPIERPWSTTPVRDFRRLPLVLDELFHLVWADHLDAGRISQLARMTKIFSTSSPSFRHHHESCGSS
jgi:hypothetical protein